MAPSDQPKKRKRGRPSAADIAARDNEDAPSKPTVQKRKRGRPSNASRLEENEELEEPEQPLSSGPNRQHDRPLNTGFEPLIHDKKKKRRRRRTNAEIQADREHEAKVEAPEPSTKRKRGRPSIGDRPMQSRAEQQTENAAEPPVVKKRRRRRTNAEILADNQAQAMESTNNHKRRRTSDNDRASNSQYEASASQAIRRKKSQRDQEELPTDDEDEISKPEYQHMRPVTRQVPREVIESKWAPLPTSAVTRINDLFHDVSRPVAMQLRDERKRNQASSAIDMVIRRLGSKLTKGMPFPPAATPHREEEFNTEKILDATRALEAQLTPILHSIELLKAERKFEEQMLADDEENLERLEENAKRAEQARRKSSTKLHPVLQGDMVMKLEESDELAGPLIRKAGSGLALDIFTDDELVPIVKQLNSHLESLENNLAPVEGLDGAILRTKAAVDDVLYRHLNTEQHEHVVRGG